MIIQKIVDLLKILVKINIAMTTGNQTKMLQQIIEENLGEHEKPDYLTSVSAILKIKHENALYKVYNL